MKRVVSLLLAALLLLSLGACGQKAAADDAVRIVGRYKVVPNDNERKDTYPYVLRTENSAWYLAGFFFGWDRALYSIIYQYVSTQTMHTLYRTYQQQTLFIVTTKAAEVCAAIHKVSHHGATILDAEGSYDHRRRQLVYSVVSGADARAAINAARSIDPDAFINSLRTTELRGNFYVRPKD